MKKTRMVQLLTQLLMQDIEYPFASEIIEAAEKMQNICKEHKTGTMKNEWKKLDKELYALLSEAEDKEIEGTPSRERQDLRIELEKKEKMIQEMEEMHERKMKELETRIAYLQREKEEERMKRINAEQRLTQERQIRTALEQTKTVKKMGEDTKVAVRNLRRDANDKVKKLEKAGDYTEDDVKDTLKEIQDLTDKSIKEIDEIVEAKEKEIMEV